MTIWFKSVSIILRRLLGQPATWWYRAAGLVTWVVDLKPLAQTGEAGATAPVAEKQPGLFARTDEELVRLCLVQGSKDERPFRELFRRHHQSVWWNCYRLVRNSQDADDLTQEVFFKAYRSLAQFEGRASFKTWLYHITVNTGRNELRRQSRRPQEAATSLDDMTELASPTGAAGPVGEAGEELLADALATLRPEEYEVLHLKELEQLPYTKIAENLGISQSAAKMRVQRARLALVHAYHNLIGATRNYDNPTSTASR